ncbi:MAG: DNA-formamidopyrimidine glycosylase family protein [Myxococcota bacterium]|nr:DNA-formamidopyrimidine glycosylase family protein [Myxococcota bacterium]
MPELPEVQMMTDLVAEVGAGQCLTRLETLDLRIWAGAEPLQSMGRLQVRRRGKLLVLVDEQYALLLHLRMTGQICRVEDHRKARLRFHFENGQSLVLLDQRCLARLEKVPRPDLEALFAHKSLGEEFWPVPRDGDWWSNALGQKAGAIKPALLTQDKVVGVGNIAASELLWRAATSPFREVSTLSLEEWDRIAQAAHDHVDYCLSKETADTLTFVTAGGPNFFRVYGREGDRCIRCGDSVRRDRQRGRATFWCAGCQS